MNFFDLYFPSGHIQAFYLYCGRKKLDLSVLNRQSFKSGDDKVFAKKSNAERRSAASPDRSTEY